MASNNNERESMTRKHFKMIAETLQEYSDNVDHVWICRDMARLFETYNPRFDKVKFMEGCGYDVREDNNGYYQLNSVSNGSWLITL